MFRRSFQLRAFLRRLIWGKPVHFRYRGYYYDYRVDRCHKPVEHYRATKQ